MVGSFPHSAAHAEFSPVRLSPDFSKLTAHPRLFVNSQNLPAFKANALGVNAAAFAELRNSVDALPEDAPMIFTPDPVLRNPDGSLKVTPGQQGRTLFRYDGGTEAAQAATVYLVTGEERYLQKAKNYLALATRVMEWCAENGIWVDLIGNVRLNAMVAYDWIYNGLTPAERAAFVKPLLRYITNAQEHGAFTFRRTIGGATDGNYGESALRYFAGIIAYGDGIEDETADRFLRDGITLFTDMMNAREATSDGTGLLAATTVGYSFGNYPYATFFFLHSWPAAFGGEIASKWRQMADFPNWFDFATIPQGKGAPFLTFGVGDMWHTDNRVDTWLMFTHLAQSIHFYAEAFPQRARQAYALLGQLPAQDRRIPGTYPFLRYLLTGFSADKIEGASQTEMPSPRYFYNRPFGLLIARSERTVDGTYMAFRFGAEKTNHQHYDELSFVIYKHGFLALDAGSRTEMDHHHAFAPQSIAHNTIFIHQENEPLPPFWRAWSYHPDGKTYFNDGGQSLLGKATPIALHSTEDFIYAAGDATASYGAEKSHEAVRQFVYLKPNLFVIYDRVQSVRADQKKEILFQLENKPVELARGIWQADNGGRLFIVSLLPEASSIRLDGGPGREFWASGRNWPLEGGEHWAKTYRTAGGWRLRVAAPDTDARAHFLTLLQVASSDVSGPLGGMQIRTDTQDGLQFTDTADTQWELLFNREGEVNLHLKQTDKNGVVVFDKTLRPGIERPDMIPDSTPEH